MPMECVSEIEIRPAAAGDLAGIAEILAASPEAAAWPAEQNLGYDCRVAMVRRRLAGFVTVHVLAEGEAEILNLAVAPQYRSRGIGKALIEAAQKHHPGDLFLEVRQSNRRAISLYESCGFRRVGERPNYYTQPCESAVVMNFRS